MKTFVRISSLMLAALLLCTLAKAGEPAVKKKQLGIATYSVKGLETDLEGVFKALQEDGYTVMEISNYNAREGTVEGYSPADYAALVAKYGMDIISSHARAGFDVKDVEGTLEAWGKIFDDHKAMGCKYVVFPMNQWADNVEDMKVECDLMNKIGDEANQRGLKFGYHNHNMEFENIPGTDQRIEDFLIQNTDPDKVFFQMDVYWVTQGHADPVEYLQKYPDRFKVLHIKDDYVIGESGNIDFAAIFKQFYKNGYKDWFVEIEEYMTPEQRAQMQAMMEQMRQRQREAQQQGQQPGQQPPQGQAQAGQGGQDRPPMMRRPQRTPEEEAQRLQTSLDAIAKSAVYLSNAKFVK
jgi:sugar phosphate isomerase/epimerase